MHAGPDQTTVATLIAENRRLRRLAELIHDHFSPADCEQFPQHGEEICKVFFMDPADQDAYWYGQARRALGLTTNACGSSRHEVVPNRNGVFHIGVRRRRVH